LAGWEKLFSSLEKNNAQVVSKKNASLSDSKKKLAKYLP
jgi:hypothetical protein